MEKYLNEAIIGNKNMLATFSGKGEMLRLSYPNRENRQYLNYFYTGVKVNDSDLIYLHDDINNTYLQYYDTDTNILNTEITNTYFNLKVLQTDFVTIKEDILVKKYTFMNVGNIELDVNFLIHSELLSDQNNFVGAMKIDTGIIQYAHDFSVATFSKDKDLLSYQINDSVNTIHSGKIQDKDYIGMSKDSSISYDIGTIKPEEKREIEICIYIDENKKTIQTVENEIERIKKIDLKKEYTNVKSYWRRYVKEHNGLELREPESSYEEKIQDIYRRSILLFPLLMNQSTGGIIAAPEIDENLTQCGRYAYCWPRDAVFIARALDILKMTKETDKFYSNFCKMTQSKNGMWEQRFYTDGKLAPCWGYQIDETASVVYGVYSHYEYTKNEEFLKNNLHMCEKAVEFLKRYVRDLIDNTGIYHVSYDIWEMCEGTHLYSLASIYSAFESMIKIYKVLGKNVSEFENNRLKDEKINKNIVGILAMQEEIKEYIEKNLYDDNKKSYVRNTEDKRMDISILGAVIPFKVFSPKEKKIQNTVENINLTIRTYTGGYQRFEYDHYRNGAPWPIANLWMTLYYLEIGEKKKAKETFDFVLKTAGKHSLLGEQIDNRTLKPNWVIGLGWSHAMFIIVLEKLNKI
jgi:glucoamylase